MECSTINARWKSCCTSHRIKHRACTIIQLHSNPTLHSIHSLTFIQATSPHAMRASPKHHNSLWLHVEHPARGTSTHHHLHNSSKTQRHRQHIHIHVTHVAQSRNLEWFHSPPKHSCSTKARSEVAHHKSHHLQHKLSKNTRTSLQPTLHHYHTRHGTHKSSQSLLLHHYCITRHHFTSQKEALRATRHSRTFTHNACVTDDEKPDKLSAGSTRQAVITRSGANQ